MTISTYGELKAALSVYLQHQRWLAQYDDATRFFENSANRRLRVRQMEGSTLLTTVSGDVALPADYLTWRTVLWNGRDPMVELDYVHPAYLRSNISDDTPIFTIEGDTFKARPVHDDTGAYELHYYQKIPSIVGADTATNWLITANADVYLFGAMVELGALQRNAEMAQLYKARRDESFAEITQLSAQTTGATSQQMRQAEFF